MKWEPKVCVHGVSMTNTCYRCALDYKTQQSALLARGYGALPPPGVPHQIGDVYAGGGHGTFDERDD